MIRKIDNRAVNRITDALEKYRPDRDDDITIIPVNGRVEHLKRYLATIGKYAIIQMVLRSSLNPDTTDWLPIWEGATVVWSYYDLPTLTREDGNEPRFNFYHAPLGVESIFRPKDLQRKYTICTHGTYLTESVRECILASGNQKVAYLNNDTGRKNVDCFVDINDEELVDVYNQCHYVSGLRRDEGFELPAAEGILCGARPIMFDQPHYRQWFDGLAEFIPEEPRPKVVESLKKIFKRTNPVTEEEIKEARKRFNWERIVTGFYERMRI